MVHKDGIKSLHWHRDRAVRQRKGCLLFCHFYVSIAYFLRKKDLNMNLWPSKERLLHTLNFLKIFCSFKIYFRTL